jgi:hypothetical protein
MRKKRPTEEQLREAADVEVAAGRKPSTSKGGVPKSGSGPREPRAHRLAQPKAVGRNKKARTTARKSGVNAARKPRRRMSTVSGGAHG